MYKIIDLPGVQINDPLSGNTIFLPFPNVFFLFCLALMCIFAEVEKIFTPHFRKFFLPLQIMCEFVYWSKLHYYVVHFWCFFFQESVQSSTPESVVKTFGQNYVLFEHDNFCKYFYFLRK